MDGFIDVLLGRRFKASKFKTLAKLAISRLVILKNHSQVRYSNAKSDVIQLLNLGHQQRALLRVEHMMKEQNLMDVFVMIEEYCYLLINRIIVLKKARECDDELKEAISSLIFASSRYGEFPELQKIRGIFVSRFGKELAAHAVELSNNCGVNPKMMQKLSTQRPSLESRMKVLKDIASENGIILDSVEHDPVLQEKLDDSQKENQLESSTSSLKHYNEVSANKDQLNLEEKMSESVKPRKKYRDAADAAHAVELSNNCGVNPKMMQKLSTQRPSLESRMKVLKDIASENGIILDSVEHDPVLQEKLDDSQKEDQLESSTSSLKHYNEVSANKDQLNLEEKMSESVKPRKKYRDAADAALEAFEAAAYAAVAARAAVELSRSKSLDSDDDDRSDLSHEDDGMSSTHTPTSKQHMLQFRPGIGRERK